MKPAARIDLAIVTSCWNYGRYLLDWGQRIMNLRTWPAMVVIVDNGSTDETPETAEWLRQTFEELGIPCITKRIERADLGTARNVAVELAAGCEWVMHFDADDELMPHALCDIAELMPDADVIALGYDRSGDLAAWPSNRRRLYSNTTGPTALASTAPASGVSPFRRSFWERSPYRTDMDGGWDTALWLGFAHLGARFRATKRPAFWYRQHADSIFNVRRLSGWPGAKVGAKLQSLRRGDAGVSVIVPRLSDNGGPRDRAWQWLARRLAALHPDWEVVVGESGRPWRKGEAVNAALQHATGSTLVIMDADVVFPSGALEEAVALVESGGAPWVVPHTGVRRLAEEPTAEILEFEPDAELRVDAAPLIRPEYPGYAGGGALVIERAAYEATRGIPTSFVGWGAEDEALAIILDTLVGPHVRLAHRLVHLWHPPGERSRDPHFGLNRQRLARFSAAVGDVDAIWATIIGQPVTLSAAAELARLRSDSRLRTLAIRAEQRARNEEAHAAKSLALRQLAAATRT